MLPDANPHQQDDQKKLRKISLRGLKALCIYPTLPNLAVALVFQVCTKFQQIRENLEANTDDSRVRKIMPAPDGAISRDRLAELFLTKVPWLIDHELLHHLVPVFAKFCHILNDASTLQSSDMHAQIKLSLTRTCGPPHPSWDDGSFVSLSLTRVAWDNIVLMEPS
jgi:hypothetical protein